MINTWMRVLTIKLTSKKLKKRLIFGNNWEQRKNNKNVTDIELSINVDGTKYLSSLKDQCIIKINNLTYKEIIQIIDGEYYEVEIITGYQNGNSFTIFNGGVLYVSNKLQDASTNEVIIICTNKLVAKYGQNKMNLSLNSGINMYSAIKFITERAGIKNSYIDEKFKKQTLKTVEAQTSKITSWLDAFTTANNLVVQGDSSEGNDVSIWNPARTNSRTIKLTNNNIILTNGYPKVNSEGLTITILPTLNLCPGDTIVIDNSIIDLSVSSKSQALKNAGQYVDKNGQYVILEITFSLSNRDSNFSYEIKGRAKSLYQNIIGVS